MSEGPYYVRFRAEVTGPWTRQQLEMHVATGRVTATHSVSTDGMTWTLVRQVPGLLEPAPLSPPVVAPAAQYAPVAAQHAPADDARPPRPTAERARAAAVGRRRFLLLSSAVAAAVLVGTLVVVAVLVQQQNRAGHAPINAAATPVATAPAPAAPPQAQPASAPATARAASPVARAADPVATATRPSGPAGWPAVYARVGRSVYMVQAYKSSNGRPAYYNSGTAWSVKPGLLATNAHVAEMFNEVGPGGFLIARRGNSENDLRIRGVRLHPGYLDSARLNVDYLPFRPEKNDFVPRLQACDVALLEVDPSDRSKQGPPLPLARTDVVESGTPVGYVGYPTEGTNTNYDVPSEFYGNGEVNRLLGYLFEAAPEGQETYVGHSLNTLGGSSGSPIVNADGEVVAVNFAGDVLASTRAGRIGMSGFKYGVPVGAVRELLDPSSLAARQAARTRAWEAVVSNAFYKGVAEPHLLLIKIVDVAFAGYAARSGLPVALCDYEVVKGGNINVRGNERLYLESPRIGPYALAVVSDQPGDGLKVDIVSDEARLEVNVFEAGGRRLYFGSASFSKLAANGRVEVALSSARATTVFYVLVRFSKKS